MLKQHLTVWIQQQRMSTFFSPSVLEEFCSLGRPALKRTEALWQCRVPWLLGRSDPPPPPARRWCTTSCSSHIYSLLARQLQICNEVPTTTIWRERVENISTWIRGHEVEFFKTQPFWYHKLYLRGIFCYTSKYPEHKLNHFLNFKFCKITINVSLMSES